MSEKLFLLTKEEFEKYVKGKSFARCKCGNEKCWWWLRGSFKDTLADAAKTSESMDICDKYAVSLPLGIRPAMYLKDDVLKMNTRVCFKMTDGTIRFAGLEWVLLDPETNLLLLKDALCLSPYSFTRSKGEYEDSDAYKRLKECEGGLFTRMEYSMIEGSEIAVTTENISKEREQLRKIVQEFFNDPDADELGEPQLWIYLKSGRSIEVVHEEDGVKEPYYSIRLHSSDKEYETGDYDESCGVLETRGTCGCQFGEGADDIINKIEDIIKATRDSISFVSF